MRHIGRQITDGQPLNCTLLTSKGGLVSSTGLFTLSATGEDELCGFFHSLYAIMCLVRWGLGSVANPIHRYCTRNLAVTLWYHVAAQGLVQLE